MKMFFNLAILFFSLAIPLHSQISLRMAPTGKPQALGFYRTEGTESISEVYDLITGKPITKAQESLDWIPLGLGGVRLLSEASGLTMKQDFLTFFAPLEMPEKLEKLLGKALEGTWNEFLKDWKLIGKKVRPLPFELLHTLTQAYVDTKLVSLVYVSYTFTGGAHGLSSHHALRWWYTGGAWQPLVLTDLIPLEGGGIQRITQMILLDLKRQGASWVLDGSLKDLTLKQLDRFHLTPQGLIFHFDPYEVGPYVQGTLEVRFDWKKIQDLLVPGLFEVLFPLRSKSPEGKGLN